MQYTMTYFRFLVRSHACKVAVGGTGVGGIWVLDLQDDGAFLGDIQVGLYPAKVLFHNQRLGQESTKNGDHLMNRSGDLVC